MLPDMDLASCPGLAVSMDVMHHVVRVESSYNPYAIGVVGGRLVRQPKTLPEALATVRMLESRGYNFSLGLAQINRYNLAKYGIGSYERAFEVCPNLQAGSRILAECYSRSKGDWGKSFSCYYSGDFQTGFRHGYVRKIYASIHSGWMGRSVAVDPMAIPLATDPVARRIAATQTPTQQPAATALQALAPAVSVGSAQAANVPAPAQRMPASTSRLSAVYAPPVQAVQAPQASALVVNTGAPSVNPNIQPSIQNSETLAAATAGLPPALDRPVMLGAEDQPPQLQPAVAASAASGTVVDSAFVF